MDRRTSKQVRTLLAAFRLSPCHVVLDGKKRKKRRGFAAWQVGYTTLLAVVFVNAMNRTWIGRLCSPKGAAPQQLRGQELRDSNASESRHRPGRRRRTDSRPSRSAARATQ